MYIIRFYGIAYSYSYGRQVIKSTNIQHSNLIPFCALCMTVHGVPRDIAYLFRSKRFVVTVFKCFALEFLIRNSRNSPIVTNVQNK